MKAFDYNDIDLESCDLVYSCKESHPLLFGDNLVSQVRYSTGVQFGPSVDLDTVLVFLDIDASGLHESGNIVTKYRTIYRAKFTVRDFANYIKRAEEGASVEEIQEDLLGYVFAATLSTVRGSLKALYVDTEFRLFLLPLVPNDEYKRCRPLDLATFIPSWWESVTDEL